MLSAPVALHDVRDAEAFVKAAIAKARGLMLTSQEREELVAEGLVILCDLARRYDPAKESDPARASFAGYANHLLPRKLGDAWHKMNPHHVARAQPDGSRKYEYLQPAGTLSRISDGIEGGGGHTENFRLVGDFVPVPAQETAA